MMRELLGDVQIACMPPAERAFWEKRKMATRSEKMSQMDALGKSFMQNSLFDTQVDVEPSVLFALFYAPRLMSAPYLLSLLRLKGEDRCIYLFDCRSANGSVTVVGIGDDKKETARRMFLRRVGQEGFRMPNRMHASAELGFGKEDLLTGWEGIGYYKDHSDQKGFLKDFTRCSFYIGLPDIPQKLKRLPILD